MHHLFIYFSAGAVGWQPCCFATILLPFAPPKVISMLVLFVTFGDFFQFIIYQVGLHMLLLLLRWSFIQPSFLSAHFAAKFLSANDSEVVDCGHERTLIWPLIFLSVSSDHRYCGQGPPVYQESILHTTLFTAIGQL